MDFTHILDELDNASLFELYRLKIAIQQKLDDPESIDKIKQKLKKGSQISWFDSAENREVQATLLEFKRTNVLVESHHDQKKWNIPCYCINLENVNTEIQQNTAKQGLSRNQLKVGDMVGFYDRDNQQRYAKVTKLNPKTVGLLVDDGHKWRVAYKWLFSVIDGEQGRGNEYFLE